MRTVHSLFSSDKTNYFAFADNKMQLYAFLGVEIPISVSILQVSNLLTVNAMNRKHCTLHLAQAYRTVALLTLILLVTGTVFGQERNRLSVVGYSHLNSRFWDGGWYVGAGLRWQNHELSFQGTPLRNAAQYWGAMYRYYLPVGGRPVSPFVGLEYTNGRSRRVQFGEDRDRWVYESQTVAALVGTDLRIAAGLHFYTAIGAGLVWGTSDLIGEENWGGNLEFNAQYGLKYDLPLQGKRADASTLPEEFDRWRVSYRYMIREDVSSSLGNLDTRAGLHQVQVEYGVNRWLSLTAGAELGPRTQAFVPGETLGYRGVGAGLRANFFREDRFSIYHEASVWHFGQVRAGSGFVRFNYGLGLEYEVLPSLSLRGGVLMGTDTEGYSTASPYLGLSFALPKGK